MKLISIIVPVYNAQQTAARCIESILAQTHAELECILVDDGSTDGSASILDAYARKDKRIRVVHTENNGVSSARNAGLALARGSFTGFVDADDWIEADMYARLYAWIEQEQADIAVCGYREEHAGNQPSASPSDAVSPGLRVLTAEQAYEAALEPDGFRGFLWNKLFRAVFFAPGGHAVRFDESVHICEDLLCLCECLSKAHKVVYDPVPLYHYTVSEASATGRAFSPRKATLLDARRKIADVTRQRFPKLSGKAETLYITDTVYICILAMHSGSTPPVSTADVRRIRKHIFRYCFGKGGPLKYRLTAASLCISPRAVHALWSLFRRK